MATPTAYPPATPSIGAPPRALGKTPTSVGQLMFPGSALPTHFQGPVVSGPLAGMEGAAGSAVLTLALQVDASMGAFSIPIQFPGGSFLQSFNAVTYQDGLVTTVEFSTQPGLADIAAVNPPAKGSVGTPVTPSKQLPLWDAVSPLKPFCMWLDVSAGAGVLSTGPVPGFIVLITYVRLPGPWSPNPGVK